MWHVLYEERNYIVAGVRLRRNFANSSKAILISHYTHDYK